MDPMSRSPHTGQRAVGVTRSQMSTQTLGLPEGRKQTEAAKRRKRVCRDKGKLLRREDVCALYSITSVVSTKPVRESIRCVCLLEGTLPSMLHSQRPGLPRVGESARLLMVIPKVLY
jgi:hypothetical protein